MGKSDDMDPTTRASTKLAEQFGGIDIYIFDQIAKGRFDRRRSVLDAGCGGGRNLTYFLREQFEVYGLDPKPEAIEHIRGIASSLAPHLPANNFRVGKIEERPFGGLCFDAVISNAVLHFAENEPHFDRMLEALWNATARGGLLFTRLASDIGIEELVRPLGERRYLLPDGSERFLVDESMLLAATSRLGGELLDPIKTTNVQNMRSMTTWCISKRV